MVEVEKSIGHIMRNPDMDIDSIFLKYEKRKLKQNSAIATYDANRQNVWDL